MMMATQREERMYGLALNLNTLQGEQDKSHQRDVYEYVTIPEEMKRRVIYTKIEGPLSDTHHTPGMEWIEEFTGMREGVEVGFRGINVSDGEATYQGLPTDLGLIIMFAGTCAPEQIAVDTENQEMLTEEQAQLREATFGRNYPRYNKWEFRIKQIIKTDGPQRAARLFEAAEEQRAQAETESFDRMGKGLEAVFSRILTMIDAKGGAVTPEAAAALQEAGKMVEKQGAKNMTPEQKDALAELEDWEKEGATAAPDADGGNATGMEVALSKKRK